MPSDSRQRMIEGAARLLAERGLQGTSFSEVLELTGAPRGSIYHHFPDGKDQLIGEAVDFAGARAIAFLDTKAGSSPTEVTEYFLYLWREVLARTNFQAGCSVLAVTVATDSPSVLERAAKVFRDWRASLTELFKTGGLAGSDAERFAATLIASTEGAIVLSRADQSMEPFDLVSEQLLGQVSALENRGT
ncbi:MAG: TetR/AcrR family transcriptional regulator, lmrAB and yxaGH operons repressor [Microbacteriaceae bacterium]|nr:TetR/AcrR family transcriptional regulator, lmrAB and yxaGH operons repressor [Microbacteriaceae bacterium]